MIFSTIGKRCHGIMCQKTASLTIHPVCLYIHGVRGQKGFFNLALKERNMQLKFDLKLPVYSLGLEIWPLSFKINFGLIGWPPQPPRVRLPKNNEIGDFWWSIPHWETRIGHFGARVDGNIKLSKKKLQNEAVEVIEVTEAVEVIEAEDILRPGKSLLMTLESSRFLNLALFLCFENHFI